MEYLILTPSSELLIVDDYVCELKHRLQQKKEVIWQNPSLSGRENNNVITHNHFISVEEINEPSINQEIKNRSENNMHFKKAYEKVFLKP